MQNLHSVPPPGGSGAVVPGPPPGSLSLAKKGGAGRDLSLLSPKSSNISLSPPGRG